MKIDNKKKEHNEDKVGGRAYSNGVRLMNDERSVKAYYTRNNGLRVEVSRIKRSKYYQYIKKIPVLRGIIALIMAIGLFLKEGINNPRKYWVIFFVIALDIIIVFLPAFDGGETANTVLDIIFIFYIIIPFILIFIFRKVITEVLKYHGAEHKAVNYYENGCRGNIQSYSRLHRRCGSNIVFYYLLITLLAVNLNIGINIWLQELIFLGLAYEMIKYTPEKLLFLPYLFQRVVTREPEERHVKVAEVALDVLTKNNN